MYLIPYFQTQLVKPTIFIIIFISLVTLSCNNTQSQNSFTYSANVIEYETGEPIAEARVTIEVTGQAPIHRETDSNGFVRFTIDTKRSGQPGRLIVEARNFLRYTEYIDMTADKLPGVIRLEIEQAISSVSSATPTPSPIPSFTSTSANNEESITPNITSTPIAVENTTPTSLPTLVLVKDTPTFEASATATPTPTAIPTAIPTSTPTLQLSATPTIKTNNSPGYDIGSETVRPKDGSEMVYVPAGNFTMGASRDDPDAQADEFPSHRVFVDAFWIDKYEVTIELYQKCANEGVCTKLYIDTPEYSDFNWSLQLPMITVNWNDATTYCEWAGGRLPTEAEWEKAAKGIDERFYPWGNSFDGIQANYCDDLCGQPWSDKTANDKYGVTSPVGQFSATKSYYGAYDMAGNVWEWVEDWYDAYPGATFQTDDFGETLKVQRGGSWFDTKDELRTTRRGAAPPDSAYRNFGFRCVVPAS